MRSEVQRTGWHADSQRLRVVDRLERSGATSSGFRSDACLQHNHTDGPRIEPDKIAYVVAQVRDWLMIGVWWRVVDLVATIRGGESPVDVRKVVGPVLSPAAANVVACKVEAMLNRPHVGMCVEMLRSNATCHDLRRLSEIHANTPIELLPLEDASIRAVLKQGIKTAGELSQSLEGTIGENGHPQRERWKEGVGPDCSEVLYMAGLLGPKRLAYWERSRTRNVKQRPPKSVAERKERERETQRRKVVAT